MAEEFLKDISKIQKPQRTKLANTMTHLGAPGREGVHMTSNVALKNLKSREKREKYRQRGTTLIDS